MNVRILLLLLCVEVPCFCQNPEEKFQPVVIGNSQIRELPSKIVGLTYKLYLKFPTAYDPAKAYDIIYLLDPEYSFAIASSVTEHLNQRNDLGDVVLIGIGYKVDDYRVNRTRDYTPYKSAVGGYGAEIQAHSGGGEKFLQFMVQELFPFVDRKVCKTRTKTLVGHSYGGLFATWVLFTKPETFNRFIVVSPSLWYDDNRLPRKIESSPDLVKTIEAKAYFTAGSGESSVMVNDLTSMGKVLAQIKPSRLAYRIETANNENHNTIFPGAFSNGLRFTFGVR